MRAMSGIALLLSVVMSTSAVDARQTIVGTWRPLNGACSPAEGSMVVGPKSLTFDAYRCEFDDVERVGDTVTWRGRCGGPDAPSVRSVVVARLKGERLFVSENRRPHDAPYVRCGGSGASLEESTNGGTGKPRPKVASSAFEGRFSADCLPGVVCAVDIRRRSGDRFDFRWSATEQVRGTRLCEHRATMTVGTGRHEAEQIEDVLRGPLDTTGDPAFAAPLRTGGLWIYLNGVACPEMSPTSSPSMNGIYVRN